MPWGEIPQGMWGSLLQDAGSWNPFSLIALNSTFRLPSPVRVLQHYLCLSILSIYLYLYSFYDNNDILSIPWYLWNCMPLSIRQMHQQCICPLALTLYFNWFAWEIWIHWLSYKTTSQLTELQFTFYWVFPT